MIVFAAVLEDSETVCSAVSWGLWHRKLVQTEHRIEDEERERPRQEKLPTLLILPATAIKERGARKNTDCKNLSQSLLHEENMIVGEKRWESSDDPKNRKGAQEAHGENKHTPTLPGN